MKKMKVRKHTSGARLFFLALMGSFVLVCVAQPAPPQVSIEIVTIDNVDYARLEWEEVEGAQLYNIYSSYDPYAEDWGEPIAIVGDTVLVYNVMVSNEKARHFYVTAEYVIPPGMVFVQGGTFNPTINSVQPIDLSVTLSSYYISKHVVTQSEWLSVFGWIEYIWAGEYGRGPNYPMYGISWYDVIEYCNLLSISEGLTPVYSYGTYGTNPTIWPVGWNVGPDNHLNISCNWNANGYRLPTEMEWEFAARGGVIAQNERTFTNRWPGTDVLANLGDYVWWYRNAYTDLRPSTKPVGTKLPNELGLYDMSGNISEWCWDMWSVYPTGNYHNPTGPTIGARRVYRSASFEGDEYDCRVFHRPGSMSPHVPHYQIGIRVARNIY